jgi:NAD(P)-dependent dehydrogenase (short-subunit alcohol dehydrogenase family)
MTINRRQFLLSSAALATAPAMVACSGDKPAPSIDNSYPTGPYGRDSTAEDVTENMDLSGQVMLVTGCNSGIGYETMRVLALRGAHVIGTGRTMEKARDACASVVGKTTPLVLELSDFQSAVDCAAQVRSLGVKLDGLILNAGMNAIRGDVQLVNGIEKMFVVNFLGHFVLVNHLAPTMIGAGHGRIVHVGSQSGYLRAPPEGIDFDNLRGEGDYDAIQAYGRSKLANALFSTELAKRLAGTGVTSNALHPGLVNTNIVRDVPEIIRGALKLLGHVIAKTPEQGAATQVYVATNPLVEGVSGAFYVDCNPARISGEHHMYDETMAAKLWATAEEMTAGYLL